MEINHAVMDIRDNYALHEDLGGIRIFDFKITCRCSSVGRTLDCGSRGHRFESGQRCKAISILK